MFFQFVGVEHSKFNTIPREKNISKGFREVVVAALQFGKGYKTISK